MFHRNISLTLFLLSFSVLLVACPKKAGQNPDPVSTSLNGVGAQRLNYRFEPDVPGPSEEDKVIEVEKRNAAVQKDFDNNRLLAVLDRTITSPNKLRVLAVYRKIHDKLREFRLDMYTADGIPLRKITHEEMAVHFPDTIRWSPDSANVAFIAVVRDGLADPGGNGNDSNSGDTKNALATPSPTAAPQQNTNSNLESNTNANSENPITESKEPAEPLKNVLTFRTEQIYICDANGAGVKPLTENEGLMYFYFVWAPNSVAMVALASPFTEWEFRQRQIAKTGELFVPAGRPRLIEKNGRERLLDDYPTPVHPVWSPDSSKIAAAFNKQVRIYDAVAAAPTQAAIPLRNLLLLSSRDYDEKLKKEEEASDGESNSGTGSANSSKTAAKAPNNPGSNSNARVNQHTSTLPDARTLVSFNPIIGLQWELDTMLYVHTGYVKTFVDNESENRRSYMRWHRLVLSPQPGVSPAKNAQ